MTQNTPYSAAAPTSTIERITAMDSLRGIAVLGILLMNIPFFGLPDPAGENPLVLNEDGTLNETIFIIVKGFFEGTQRALFSMLFGAGVIIFISRLESRSYGIIPADLFIRRQLWLVLFGLFNAYVLLWAGDILFSYGICGIILFSFRKLSVRWLLLAAGVCLVLMTARENVDLYRKKEIISKGELAALMDSSSRSVQQKVDLESMMALKAKSSRENLKNEMEKNFKKLKGSYADAYDYMKDLNFKIETELAFHGIWDLLIFMFIGMAFFKAGLMSGEARSSVYFPMAAVGLSVGGFVSWLWVSHFKNHGYDSFEIAKHRTFYYSELARTIRSLGLFGLIMLMFGSRFFRWFSALMKPVGRMAFTNYLSQSFMCNLFFLGAGFGMMGSFDRKELYLFVLAVWMLQICWSHLWLRYFQFGPLEWCWRSLTYWKLQPMIKEDSAKI